MPRTAQQVLLVLGWLLIAGLTVNAVVQDGAGLLYNWTFGASSMLILTDLTVELILISIFIWVDCRRRGGRNPWGWIVVTLILGGVGSLGYLLARMRDPQAPPVFGAGTARPAGEDRPVG